MSGSGCGRGRSPSRRPRRRDCAWSPWRRPSRRRISSWSSPRTKCSASSTPRRSPPTWCPATPCSSPTVSTSGSATSRPRKVSTSAWSHPRVRGTWCAASTPRAGGCPPSSPLKWTPPGAPGRWRFPMPRPSVRCAPAVSKRRSRRRLKPTCSANRRFSAAASPLSSSRVSRPWSRPVTSPRWPTSSACMR